MPPNHPAQRQDTTATRLATTRQAMAPQLAEATASTANHSPDLSSDTIPIQQLELRLFERVGTMRGSPPERALWRELLDLALGTMRRFEAMSASSARAVSAAVVHHVGLALYFRADEAGIVQGFTAARLATDCRLERRCVVAALRVLESLRVIRRRRTSRRRPEELRLNCGGLDWPAVRRRADRDHPPSGGREPLLDPPGGGREPLLDPPGGGREPLLDPPSGGHEPPPSSGHEPPLKCYTEDQQQQQERPTLPPTTRQMSGLVSMADELGIDPPRPSSKREADHWFRDLKNRVEKHRASRRAAQSQQRSAAGWDTGRNEVIEDFNRRHRETEDR